jgi:HEPN domain-containing protein
MNPAAKSLILKAQDNLETAKKYLDDDQQHDIVGYNLAQACEYFLKSLCAVRDLEYPHDEEGHDLDALMSLLEEDNLSAVSSYADLVELTQYNSTGAHIRKESRLNLRDYLAQLEDFKGLVREHTM